MRLILLALIGILFSACAPTVGPSVYQDCIKREKSAPPYSLEQLAIEQECKNMHSQRD